MARRLSTMSSSLADQLDRDLDKCRWFVTSVTSLWATQQYSPTVGLHPDGFGEFSLTEDECATLVALQMTRYHLTNSTVEVAS